MSNAEKLLRRLQSFYYGGMLFERGIARVY